MIIDIIFAVLVILAILKGYRQGLIIGVFSLIAFIVGLAAAMKLSMIAARYIGQAVSISDRWLPILSFLAVFIVVILLVRLGAKALEKTAELITLGWLNKLGGILLYAAIYTIIFSVLLFYAEQVRLMRPGTIENSVTYSFIRPVGPWVIDGFATILPFFGDMFKELEQFFEAVSKKISSCNLITDAHTYS